MFTKFFNIGTPSEPVLVYEESEIAKSVRIPKAKKVNATKVLQSLLNDLQNVNNPKVDALRMLAIAIENGGDVTTLKAFCKEPIRKKKKK